MTPLKLTSTLLTITLLTSSAQAGFHVMQIEEIIGGINGNTTAQAIQLRLKSAGQNLVSNASIWAADATGSNRVLLLDISANVTNSAGGARVLLATSAFTTAMNATGGPAFVPDFTLATPIPVAYLNAGKITFESDGGTVSTPGTVYWAFAWGGATYTGTNTGSTQNDSDGFFGDNLAHSAPFASALPTTTFGGVIFTGASSAASTNNAADYAATSSPAIVTKNNATFFTVVPEPGSLAFVGIGALALAGTVFGRRRSLPRRD